LHSSAVIFDAPEEAFVLEPAYAHTKIQVIRPRQYSVLKSRMCALLCAFALLFCSVITHPVAETGMNDDGPYIRSAQLLAQTGHVVYNGWATAMLGWQLFLGALFAHLFGPSFTAIRASTLLVAIATAFLTHRTLVRAGVNTRNATLGTLALVLSPLFLPLAFSFMSDIGGLFCIVLCFYACLRALQAKADWAMLGWLVFAATSNALGGTVRQIAWLGVLVIFPSTVWLLRQRRGVVLTGLLLYSICAVFVVGSLQWFLRQPYSIPEPLIPPDINLSSLNHLVFQLLSMFFTFALLLLPILISFAPVLTLREKFTRDRLIAGGVLCLLAFLFFVTRQPQDQPYFFAPYLGNYLSLHGLVDGMPIMGNRPLVLSPAVRVLLTIFVFLLLNCFFIFLLVSRGLKHSLGVPSEISGKSLQILFMPFLIAYVALLVPRGLSGTLFDRYLLPLLPIGLIFLLRLFQNRVGSHLPFISGALLVVFATYAVAGTHDAFSMFRARQAAVVEIRTMGVPATLIDAGFNQNMMTQIDSIGYLNDPRIRVPKTVYVARFTPYPEDCRPQGDSLTPAVVPGYTLSFDPAACGGLSHFAPVSYRQWLWGETATVYVVKTLKTPPAL
jgi:hypothetical protein